MGAASPCKRHRRHGLLKLQYSAVTAESLKFRNMLMSKAELVTYDI